MNLNAGTRTVCAGGLGLISPKMTGAPGLAPETWESMAKELNTAAETPDPARSRAPKYPAPRIVSPRTKTHPAIRSLSASFRHLPSASCR